MTHFFFEPSLIVSGPSRYDPGAGTDSLHGGEAAGGRE